MNRDPNLLPLKMESQHSKDSISFLDSTIEESRNEIDKLKAEGKIEWAFNKFKSNFAITTSFGIQSSVLLHMLSGVKAGKSVPVIWVDTGYFPQETYLYADQLTKQLDLDLRVVQSPISPARMEALYGKLWETKSLDDLEKYHLIRKVRPLEHALNNLNVHCWASGVRGVQTDNRRSMSNLDIIRGRLSLRPLLQWSQKDIYYYMQKNKLPQHPLFEKGYSTVGDWHSSSPETNKTQGRETRFGGLKQECGIHDSGQSGLMGEGI